MTCVCCACICLMNALCLCVCMFVCVYIYVCVFQSNSMVSHISLLCPKYSYGWELLLGSMMNIAGRLILGPRFNCPTCKHIFSETLLLIVCLLGFYSEFLLAIVWSTYLHFLKDISLYCFITSFIVSWYYHNSATVYLFQLIFHV